MSEPHKILILDFGSQFTQLIARRIREIGTYCEIYACDTNIKAIKAFRPKGIILSGGPNSTYAENAPQATAELFELNIPILGICYGMQWIAQHFGGTVQKSAKHEYGYAQVRAHGHTPLLNDIQDNINELGHGLLDVWMSHGDQVSTLPESFIRMNSTPNCPIAGMANVAAQIYAIQFHPEVTHTTQGQAILSRFVSGICQCDNQWVANNIIDEAVASIQQQVGQAGNVLLALSGGVDSSVCALLLHRAIGNRLHCVFVDNGLLRLNEGDEVMALFSDKLGLNVLRINAQDQFFRALKDVDEPEEKRKIIGNQFIKVFEQQAAIRPNIDWLAQGTIYPDVIESAAAKHGKAKVIKSHHNVGGLPSTMKLKLIEPLRALFKDEVRKIGLMLGLNTQLLHRHPFPGPGLGVRILGQVTEEYARILRQGDAIFIEELRRADWYDKVSQAFVVFLPVKTVGVVGDARRYGYVLALRAVQTPDFMTAKWADLPTTMLSTVSNRIINEVPEISRVVYDISGKPPATIEWE